MKCSVKLCTNRQRTAEKSISFHRFPKVEWKKKKWMTILEMDEVTSRSVVCSQHFHASDFINNSEGQKKMLFPSTMPYLAEEFQESDYQMSRLLSPNSALFLKNCFATTYKQVLLNNQSCLLSIAKQSQSSINTTTIPQKKLQENSDKFDLNSKSFHKYQHIMDVPDGIFRGKTDRFNGVTVDSNEEHDDDVNFADKLQKSIDYWSENGRRGIWFKVQTKHSQYVPELTKRGFDFHHAKNGYVMLFRWLPTNETVNVPVFAHTLCGVGGLVVNDKNEILAVSDRYALIPNSWKLPGGYVEPNEDFVDAAIREVREETGIETTFETVIGVRQSHGGSFGCSDLYFVIALKPITSQLAACPREISKVQWMPVAEYLQHPHVHETNRQFVRTFLHYKESGIKFNCVEATHQILKRKYCLYLVEKQAEQK